MLLINVPMHIITRTSIKHTADIHIMNNTRTLWHFTKTSVEKGRKRHLEYTYPK